MFALILASFQVVESNEKVQFLMYVTRWLLLMPQMNVINYYGVWWRWFHIVEDQESKILEFVYKFNPPQYETSATKHQPPGAPISIASHYSVATDFHEDNNTKDQSDSISSSFKCRNHLILSVRLIRKFITWNNWNWFKYKLGW